MSEELTTNQVAETPAEVQTETPSTVENTTPETVETTPQLVKLKYNHEERELPLDEVVTLAQKGMNYDKINDRKQELESNPSFQFVEKIAKFYGVTPQEYIEAVEANVYQSQINELKLEGIPEHLAQELIEARQEKMQRAEQTAMQEQEQELLTAHPELVGTQLPEEVMAMMAQGKRMLEAYQAYDNKQLRQRISTLEQALNIKDTNEKNAQTSPGSVTGGGSVDAGFFTKEQVDAMSQAEVTKHLDAILESRKHWK